MIKPHEYQKNGIDEIIEKFETNDSLVYQLDTGGGKTVVFSLLSKYWSENRKQKVLILCHREELINQSCETLTRLGLTYEKVLPSTKRLHHVSDVYVAMIETLDRRLKKNKHYLKDVGLIISDEAHVQIFNKVYGYFHTAKILGVTATPVLLGRDTYWKCDRCQTTYTEESICCKMETIEWSRPRKMSDIYQDIVVGPKIDFLIDFGQLVKEINFVRFSANLDNLVVDNSGDFSQKSQDTAFGGQDAVFNVLLNYEELAKGKRTIIFNNSTKTNLKVYEQFKEKGYNVKIYDSVNDTGESRKKIVDWFRNTPDAILCNCGVFVAGFDCKEVECVVLNVATTSLSRYLQMVGRGGRSSSLIYKPHFLVIDGGGNVERFNAWSDPTRDWRKIFFEGIGKDRAKSDSPLQVSECNDCGFLFPRSERTCPNCGYSAPLAPPREPNVDDSILAPLDKLPLPNGLKIANYTKSRNEDIHFAFKVLYSQILDLFRFHLVSRKQYLSNLNDGRLDKRIGELIRPVYFVLIKEFPESSNRTLKYVINKCKEKIAKYYQG